MYRRIIYRPLGMHGLRRKMRRALDTAKDRLKETGRTGRINSSTGLPYANPCDGAPAGKVWVRVGAKTRSDYGRRLEAVWHRNRVTLLRSDVPVELDRRADGSLQIDGSDVEQATREFGEATAALYQSADPAPEELNKTVLSRRNLSDFRPRLADSGGLTLYVAPGWYRGHQWAGGTLDQTSYVTATSGQFAYVVVGFDDGAGALVADTGPDYATAAAADPADIATVFAGATFATARPVAAVLLQNGATSFLNADIVDIRDVTAARKSTVVVAVTTDDVSNPPTDAELDTAFGTPAALGAGFVGLVNDGGADTTVWLAMSTGAKWFYASMTEAV